MFNNADILAMLQNGQSAEAIAQSFTDALNAAIAADNEAKAAEQMKSQKREDTQILVDTIYDYLSRYYPEIMTLPGVTGEYDADEVIAAFDALMPTLTQTFTLKTQLKDLFKPFDFHGSVTTTENGKSVTKEFNDADVFAKFFKENGLI